ncbi:MAG: hypothetical protein H6532_05155 [Thermoleophilales bacterium]|nr:hypothetical protein [Thermoleophilales bacterium]
MSNPTVHAFVDQLVSGDLSEEATAAGAIPPPGSAVAANRSTWTDAGG